MCAYFGAIFTFLPTFPATYPPQWYPSLFPHFWSLIVEEKGKKWWHFCLFEVKVATHQFPCDIFIYICIITRQEHKQQMLARMWEKGILTLLVEMWISTTTMENNMKAPQKTKNRITIWSSNSTSRDMPERMWIRLQHRHLHNMFTAALFTIAKIWKQPGCPTTDEWIKKMYLYAMEFYSTTKKNEILSFAVNGWNWKTSF
jgi:hypothetical protein